MIKFPLLKPKKLDNVSFHKQYFAGFDPASLFYKKYIINNHENIDYYTSLPTHPSDIITAFTYSLISQQNNGI